MHKSAAWIGVAVLVAGISGTAAGDTWTDYSSIGPTLLSYESTYPTLCKRYDLGLSVQGRHLWAIRISDNVQVEEDEPEFRYIAAMHGDEIVGTKLMMMLVDYLMTNYGTDPQATNIVDNVELWILPLTNPDGYDQTYRTRYNAEGVDLNRDFPQYGEANTTTGRAPETAAVMNWSFGRSFVVSANLHGGALVVNYPFDSTDTGSQYTPDDDLFVYISEQYSQYNLPMWNGAWYHGTVNGVDWYTTHGGIQDWSYLFMGDNDVTIEQSNTKEPSASTIGTYWNDNRQSLMAYIETSLLGVRGIVTDGPTGEPLAATVTVQGRDHEVFTDPEVGDYHRMLLPGTYTLTFSAAGYDPKSISNVVVASGPATRLDVVLGPAPPSADDVSVEMDALQSTAITLAGSDPDNGTLDYIITSLPAHGSLADPNGGAIASAPYTLASHGDQVTYTADDYVGSDGFQYKVNDGGTPPYGGDSNIANVLITLDSRAPTIETTSLVDGYNGYAYGPVSLVASGGEQPLFWRATSGGDYQESDLGTSQFAATGTAQGWQGDDNYWTFALPFSFPFYGDSYDTIRVCANGFIDCGVHAGSVYNNSTTWLKANKMIAPLWDDLTTENAGDDVFIDTSTPNEVTVRWEATLLATGNQVRVSATLRRDGSMRFAYGAGNAFLTPTIGISKGDGVTYLLASYDGASDLNNANSIEIAEPSSLPAGMTLSADGQLSGTPTESGTFQPTFVVSDALDRTDELVIPLTIINGGPPDGDADLDGDVDLADFAEMQACFGSAATGSCGDAFEMSVNGVIDLADYAQFADHMTGPQ